MHTRLTHPHALTHACAHPLVKERKNTPTHVWVCTLLVPFGCARAHKRRMKERMNERYDKEINNSNSSSKKIILCARAHTHLHFTHTHMHQG